MEFRLRESPVSTFEAGMLKIRALIRDKRIIFPEKSLIKAQLAMFSTDDLSKEEVLYALRAFSLVVGALDKRKPAGEQVIEPKLKAWW